MVRTVNDIRGREGDDSEWGVKTVENFDKKKESVTATVITIKDVIAKLRV